MAGSGHQSYVREFTRHAGDVLMNLNVLRKRQVLTDVTLRVGGCPLQAHKAVLTACSGFFYSIFLGQGGHEVDVLTLPSSIEPVGFQALLDFMYTSRLLLSPGTAPAILVAASYLQMEHVVQSCHRFIQTSSEQVTFLWAPPAPKSLCHQFQPLEGKGEWGGSLTASLPRWGHNAASKAALLPPASYPTKEQDSGPARSPGAGAQFPPGHPASPGESSSCAPMPPDPRACNWKKYRFIVLNSRLQVGQTEPHSNPAVLEGEAASRSQEGAPIARAPAVQAHCSACSQEPHSLHSTPPEDPSAEPGEACSPIGEKPYHCGVCGAQFNRPANLKTHLRIHSGEKPYKCETCGSCFVQVAHLRAHVLIHTGEKPYPCGTCGTRFRHLQTLKSHIRIHTGEKPYHCEKCSVRFRHKSQLRLHLRQKHGAITNTKIRYHVLDGPRIPLC